MKRHEKTLMGIGATIRKHRESQNYSQESFADKIRMHRTYCSAVERGEQNMTIESFQKICDGLDVKMWEILRDVDA